MNPKEKAEKLIIKFKTPLDVIVPNTSIKENAIKCVDEIINLLIAFHGRQIPSTFSLIDYYKEVKKEIENYERTAN